MLEQAGGDDDVLSSLRIERVLETFPSSPSQISNVPVVPRKRNANAGRGRGRRGTHRKVSVEGLEGLVALFDRLDDPGKEQGLGLLVRVVHCRSPGVELMREGLMIFWRDERELGLSELQRRDRQVDASGSQSRTHANPSTPFRRKTSNMMNKDRYERRVL